MLAALLDDPRIAEVHEVALEGLDAVRTSGAIPNEYLVYYSSTEEIAHAFGRDGSRGAILASSTRFYHREPSSPPTHWRGGARPRTNATRRTWRRREVPGATS